MKRILFSLALLFIMTAASSAQETKIYSSFAEMVEAAKAVIDEISINDFHAEYAQTLQNGNPDFILIDIRTEAEYIEGYIPGAFLIQRGTLESRLEKDEVWEAFNYTKPEKSDTIILYCRTGNRGALAARSLMMLGYTNVKSMEGGWKAWSEEYPNLIMTN